jgi:predicted NBD/HSP70 family sugar kinase
MSMPSAVRHINEARILESLYRNGSTTRADLARELRLMRSTVGNLITNLVGQGLVSETEISGSGSGGRAGRPGQLVQLNPAHAAFIGVDIGVGHISVVAVDLVGHCFKSQTQLFSPPFGEVDATVDTVVATVQAFLQQIPPEQPVHGICVAVPGLLDRSGTVLRAPVLGWNAVPIENLVRSKLAWTGVLASENDANAFAAAELYSRSPATSSDALFVYLDAGIGGGLVSQGKLLRGHRGYAGEIGHIHLGEQGFDPLTPIQGSFESYVGRNAVLARYQQHGGKAGSLEQFVAALLAREAAALSTIAEWAWWLGRGIASLVSVFDPGRIVLGGPVAVLYPHAAVQTMESVRKHLVQPTSQPHIEVSQLGPDACAIGAAMTLHHELLSIDERLVYGAANES